MIVTPAIDLRGGKCVQLVGGEYDREMVTLDDPISVATDWERRGFETLHVVDLDAATENGSNRLLVERILTTTSARVQVGGGLRSTEAIMRVLDRGASGAVVGTRAIENADWLASVTKLYPQRIVVAADVRGRRIQVRGWQQSSTVSLDTIVENLNELSLAGILVTAVHREGAMLGPDLELLEHVIRLSSHPIQAAGGIRNNDDIRALSDAGVSRAVIGMALYTGALDFSTIDQEMMRL
jgi:phosphoribosylformimino-5-aminoimidazole carboxamide ribotide isomerase